MSSIDILRIEAQVIIDDLDEKIEAFEDVCIFLEENLNRLSDEDPEDLLTAFVSARLYGNLFIDHVESEKRKVHQFKDNSFQLTQCLHRLKPMVHEMESTLSKLLSVKQRVEETILS